MSTTTLHQLEKRREQICDEIASIKSLRRGTLGEWSYTQTLKDGTVKKRGPFYRITRKNESNKTVSTPVPKAELEYFSHEVENYHKLRDLTDNLAEVCENISIMAKQEGDDSKKN